MPLGMRPQPDVHRDAQRLLRRGLKPGMRVLDVGCGDGPHLRELGQEGMETVGVEIDPALVAANRAAGLHVLQGTAEALPVDDASFDAIICSVVMPYTDQRRAVREWARVLKPGGTVNATYHGAGYGIHYFLVPPEGFRSRFYGARMLVNTALYVATGQRLPGFIGDTLCQTQGEMQRSYRSSGFVLTNTTVIDSALGIPRILFHALQKN